MKTCTKCGEEKPLDDFYKQKRGRFGVRAACKKCTNEQGQLAYQNGGKDRWSTARKMYQKSEQSKNYRKVWAEENREKVKDATTRYRKKNPEYTKEYYENNKHINFAASAKRRAAKMHRTPSWLNDDHMFAISEIYELRKLRSEATGVEHHVDHIVPLQGKTVSGLHVPWNLQVIPASENLSKSNFFAA